MTKTKFQTSRRLAWTASLLSLFLALAAVVIGYRLNFYSYAGEIKNWYDPLIGSAIVIAALLVGGLIAARLPQNVYGWVWILMGLGAGVVQPWSVLAAAWALIAAAVITALLLWAVPGKSSTAPFDNPFGVQDVFGQVAKAMTLGAVFVIFLGGLPLSVLSLGVRFRQSSGLQRAQLKWLAFAAAINLVLLLIDVSRILQPWVSEEGMGTISNLLLAALPAAIGVAILKVFAEHCRDLVQPGAGPDLGVVVGKLVVTDAARCFEHDPGPSGLEPARCFALIILLQLRYPIPLKIGDNMKYNVLFLSGVLAVIVYVGTVILGGILRPGYSHISQFVSDLIASGAPNKSLLDPLFLIYNLLTGGFAVGLFFYVNAQAGPKPNLGTFGALALLLEAIFGFLTVFFPEGPHGAPITSTGTMHIVLAGLSSLATIVTILLVGLWFRGVPGMAGLSLYSIVTVIVVFISGGLTAAFGASGNPLLGLLERITIGAFLQWMLVIGLRLYT